MVTVAMVTRVGCEAENEVGDGKDGVSGGIAYIEGKAEQGRAGEPSHALLRDI